MVPLCPQSVERGHGRFGLKADIVLARGMLTVAPREQTQGGLVVFQPFGYRFEVRSPTQPFDVKAVIRSRKKQWFDPKDGARGWIVGPFICLWFSAFDRYGPMLFGRIVRDGFGTRITGRAGSDLNGLAMVCLVLPLIPWLFYHLLAEEALTTKQILFLGGSMALLLLVFWTSHKFRRDAEPLVRFLGDAVTPTGRALRKKSANTTISKAFSLDVGGESGKGPVTPDAIHDALLGIGSGDFVILASAPETYLQTAFRDGGYIIEKRDGDDQRHFRALRRTALSTGSSDPVFSFDEVRETFMAYASEAPIPPFLTWEPMQLPL
jgi:hypothetical protein